MVKISNPFIISGYVAPQYFCDREVETETLTKLIENGNNVALISTRRLGKTGLIKNYFEQEFIKEKYNTFFIDIYSTKNLREFVYALSKEILKALKPLGKKAIEQFWNSVKSLQAGISFDPFGNPNFGVQLGDIRYSETTLDEIFAYLESSPKPCIVAIDEFQQITNYPESNIEAILRTHIQQCKNSHFIFAGSQRHIMGNMFTSPSRPFYQSVSMIHLEAIAIDKYIDFALTQFENYGKKIDKQVVIDCYNKFNGITWYIQKMLNTLFFMTEKGDTCSTSMINTALQNTLESMDYAYSEMIFRLSDKQKELLLAINQDDVATNITSSNFIKRHNLASASSIQSAIKILLDKDFVTLEQGRYQLYDQFLSIWLKERF